ncbi:MAG: ribonuclease [Beijerinckiaceae bacterium]
MDFLKIPSLLIVGLCMFSASAPAQVAMTGTLAATRACPAYQSIRNQTNPGGVITEPGNSYKIIGKNKEQPTYFQIAVDGASPSQRWVEVTCGDVAEATLAPSAVAPATHVLALGWEPAFCLQHSDKPECANETTQSPDTTQLSLHGLWPQPRGKAYCNVARDLVAADKSHDWASLPEPDISPTTRHRLSAVMPGYQSGLPRHEWIVHGTCFGATADAYFNRAADFAEQINATGVSQLFAQNIGNSLSSDTIRSAFDKAFGAGAGARVTVNCQGRDAQRKIGELVIALAGDVAGSARIGDVILAASPAPAGCPGGLIAQPAH